ncbi:MAG: hypothetical protein DHS20C14_05690 [Phycisphaeraceae bacterium]|nr:MAG: hypothetical protein DHS20C14_05690 [Phycisphaeraceae bacterium]
MLLPVLLVVQLYQQGQDIKRIDHLRAAAEGRVAAIVESHYTGPGRSVIIERWTPEVLTLNDGETVACYVRVPADVGADDLVLITCPPERYSPNFGTGVVVVAWPGHAKLINANEDWAALFETLLGDVAPVSDSP